MSTDYNWLGPVAAPLQIDAQQRADEGATQLQVIVPSEPAPAHCLAMRQ